MHLNFHSFRPAYIYPDEKRIEPNFAYVISRWLYPLVKLFGKKFSIKASELAKAIVRVSLDNNYNSEILENHQILDLID